MNVKPIRTEQDYELALKRVESLMDAEVGTEDFDELEVLTTLIENYEAHIPLESLLNRYELESA